MKTKSLRLDSKTLSILEKTVILAALDAGKVLKKNFGKRLAVREKKDAGLVTHVDLAAEKAALLRLKKFSSTFSLLTEETHPEFSRTEADFSDCWIVDPLDGTTNFIHGFPMFCVSIAAQVAGELAVGVIYHPILDDLYVAVRGKGARVNKVRMKVSQTSQLRDSLLTTGFTYRKNEWLHAEMTAFEKLSRISRAVRRPGSAALDLAYTARGIFDGFWERRLSPWDVAAGTLLVREAGGCVTDFSGKPYQIRGAEIMASNFSLHKPLLRELRRR